MREVRAGNWRIDEDMPIRLPSWVPAEREYLEFMVPAGPLDEAELIDALLDDRHRLFDDLTDALGAAVQALGNISVLEAELGGDHHLVADRGQCFAQKRFVGEGAIGFGGVEMRDAKIMGAADQGHHLRRVGRRAIGR